MSNFTIDYFELMFLAEACIPRSPIARAYFWEKLTDVYWDKMTENERSHLFNYMNRQDRYKDSLIENEETKVFHARFDPNNQFMISYERGKKKGEQRAFLFQDTYWLSTRTFIPTEIIKDIKKINPTSGNLQGE